MAVYHLPSEALEEQNYFYVGAEDGTELLVIPQSCKDLPNHFDGFVYLPWDADVVLSAPITPKTLIPESLGNTFHQNPVLISSQICGGTLRYRLEQAIGQYGKRLFFLIEPYSHLLPLPCPHADPKTVSAAESAVLRSRFAPFFTEDFCCRCCICTDLCAVHLYDTVQTLEEKTQLALSLSVENIIRLPIPT